MPVLLNERYTFDEAKMSIQGGGLREDGTPKDLFMEGIFVQGNTVNHNRRNYPVNEIRKAVDQINKSIDRGESVLGEADHPEELNINLPRVSHVIEKMWMDGPNGYGKLRILRTPMGNLVRTMLEDRIKLGVSSRGSGNVDHTGSVSDFEMVTVDIVARPSAPNAYPVPVYEALNARRGRIIEDLATAMTYEPEAQEFLQKELLAFFNSLKS